MIVAVASPSFTAIYTTPSCSAVTWWQPRLSHRCPTTFSWHWPGGWKVSPGQWRHWCLKGQKDFIRFLPMNLVPETWGNIAVLWQFPIWRCHEIPTSEKRWYGQQKGIILMLADVGRYVGRYVGSGIPICISLYEASTYKLCIIPTIKTCWGYRKNLLRGKIRSAEIS